MIAPIPAVYYARMVCNGLLTPNLVIVWLSNKNIQDILSTFDIYGFHSQSNSPGFR